jgi:hypothetical protein
VGIAPRLQVHAQFIDSGLHAHTEIFDGRIYAPRSLVPHRLAKNITIWREGEREREGFFTMKK